MEIMALRRACRIPEAMMLCKNFAVQISHRCNVLEHSFTLRNNSRLTRQAVDTETLEDYERAPARHV
jgi:hypothetical protein